MNIYQKKQKKETKKKRYPDIPNNTKQSNYVQYSIEDKDFLEQKAKPIFSGEMKKGLARYNPSRSSNKIIDD